MKKILFIGISVVLILSFFLAAFPINADDPQSSPSPPATPVTPGQTSDLPVVKPINDIREARPASNLGDYLNPTDPQYHPEFKNLPNPRYLAIRSSKAGPLASHTNFGTDIYNNSSILGAYAYQYVHTLLDLAADGEELFAPTLMAPNNNSVELAVAYWRAGTTTYRALGIFNWNTRSWARFYYCDANFISNYIRNSVYITEILFSGGTWWACIYNWNTLGFDYLYGISSQSITTVGWDIWEEYNLDSSYPYLPQITSNYLNVSNNGVWHQVDATYGNTDNGIIHYNHGFYQQWYYWWVGPGS